MVAYQSVRPASALSAIFCNAMGDRIDDGRPACVPQRVSLSAARAVLYDPRRIQEGERGLQRTKVNCEGVCVECRRQETERNSDGEGAAGTWALVKSE
jgi:hypothetical protein